MPQIPVTTSFFVLLSLLFGAVSAVAQPRQITIEEAKRLALERNIDVIQRANNVESADAAVLSAYGNYLPSLSANAGWSRSQSQRTSESSQVIEGVVVGAVESFSVTNSFTSGLSTNLTVFDGLSREGQLENAKARYSVAEKTSVRTRQAVVYQVVAGYLNVVRNRELVRVSEENLKRDQRQLERIEESNRVGALSVADVYRQQSQVASDELSVINAQNNYEKSIADLVALIGLDPFIEYEFRDPEAVSEIDSAAADATLERYRDLTGITKTALSYRPDFVAAEQNLRAAESEVTIARATYFPAVSAFGSYGNFSNELDQLSLVRNYTLNWGLNLRWNVFDGFNRDQQIESSEVTRRNAEISLSQTERSISVEVRKALLDLEAARKSWEVSDKGLVSADQDRRIAEERYNLGAGTLLDLLVANASYVNAQANRVNSVISFVIAKYNMEFVLGERAY
jgi:outer membrane protein